MKGYTLGNGEPYARGFDLDGRAASYTTSFLSFNVGYDAASRITSLRENRSRRSSRLVASFFARRAVGSPSSRSTADAERLGDLRQQMRRRRCVGRLVAPRAAS